MKVADVDATNLWSALRIKQKVMPIWKKLWKPMTRLVSETRDRLYLASRGRDAEKGTAGRGRKDNNPIAVPCATTRRESDRQRLHLTADGIDAFELVVCKEADGPAIRSPEWEHGILCSLQRLC